MRLIVLILLLFIKGIAQAETSAIIITYNEPMSGIGLTTKSNYKITDPYNVRVTIFNIKVFPDSTKVMIFCKRINYKQTYKIVVSNVKDKAGNLIDPIYNKATFIFEGITNKLSIPVPELKK